jgi:hypothetical protein
MQLGGLVKVDETNAPVAAKPRRSAETARRLMSAYRDG